MKIRSKINTYRSLLHLVNLDETDHAMKDMANLFLSALRDWGNCKDIFKCIENYKAYFGNPLTLENTAHYTGRLTEDWAWRAEAGTALSWMIERSTKAYNISDFDTIVDTILSHYEQKYLLTTKGKPVSNRGYARFDILSNTLMEADYLHGLVMVPDSFGNSESKYWTINTPLTLNINQSIMIQQIVKRLMPIKDRLIAFKQAYPDLTYELTVVVWSSELDLGLSNDTLLFLGEIGATLQSEMFAL